MQRRKSQFENKSVVAPMLLVTVGCPCKHLLLEPIYQSPLSSATMLRISEQQQIDT